jgi:hypothetical protein
VNTQPTIELTPEQANWPEALATVTACKYDFGAGRALAFGIPTSKHYRIAYNYNAPNEQGDEELHTGQFPSAKPIPQGTLFPIRYNPNAPHQNSHDAHTAPQNPRAPLLIIGILGSIILSLAWFALLRSCH